MGNAIDTTMATMTPKSTYTAKGSIAAATGASTPANLSVGNNGETLVADSSTATGLKWAAPATGMTNPMTTTGDLIYSSPGSTPVRRGIGSTGQILTVAGGVPTWATPSAPGQSFTSLNSSSLSGTTYTVSGLSGYNTLAIYYSNVVSDGGNIIIRLNTDTGANYNYYGGGFVGASSWASSNIRRVDNSASTNITVIGNATTNANAIGLTIFGANGTGPKQFIMNSGTGNGPIQYSINGYYTGGSVISSISIIGASSFTGTVQIYGA
jgi:hypothetical protein